MNKLHKLLILIFLIIASIFIFTYEGLLDNNKNQLKIFHRGNADEIDTLDPHKAADGRSYSVINDLFEGLMTYDSQGKLTYGQANGHQVTQDGLHYTFILKENLKWSNGDKLTSHDFVAGFRRTVDPTVGAANAELLKPIKNADAIINNKLDTDKLAIKAIDNHTLQIDLEHPTPYFLELLVHPATMPAYRANLQKYGDKYIRPEYIVSNGAFKLDKWVINSHLSVVKNSFYYNANNVKLDKVIFYPITEKSIELKKYRANELDYTNSIPANQYTWIKENYSNELYIKPLIGTYFFEFNNKTKPFKNNKNLRKALSLAVDKTIIADKIVQSGQVATDYIVPDIVNNYLDDSNPKLQRKKLNPITQKEKIALANSYYKKAGYSKEKPLEVEILYNTDELHKAISVAIASMWKKNLGVKTKLVNQEWKVYLQELRDGTKTQFVRRAWVGLFNDPISFFNLFVSNDPNNTSGYHNDEFDKLIEASNYELDINKRAEILMQAEQILLEDQPVLPLYTYTSTHLIKPNIKGFVHNPLGYVYDKYIYKF